MDLLGYVQQKQELAEIAAARSDGDRRTLVGAKVFEIGSEHR